ncbi:MAG: hypothetical protein WC738_04280 [Candidatus Omnitrophota bacterium]|jgi:hypothetical protein
MKSDEVIFQAHFDPNKTAIRIDGEGQSTITFTADSTQLAKVLTSFSLQKNSLLEVRVKRLPGDLQNGPTKGRARTRGQTIR